MKRYVKDTTPQRDKTRFQVWLEKEESEWIEKLMKKQRIGASPLLSDMIKDLHSEVCCND